MTESKPIIFVDQRKKRIRIHKTTLKLLGNPKYIQLLINPEQLSLVIRSCERKAPLALKINPKVGECCELYSTNLVKLFYGICSKWDNVSQYRLYGKLVPDKALVCFYMKDGEVYKEQEGRDEQ